MGIFKKQNEKIERIVREEVDEPRRKAEEQRRREQKQGKKK